MNPRIIDIRKNVLDKNDQLARGLRARFQAAKVCVVNLVSSPGTGKTALLQRTLQIMKDEGYAVAALVGDLATENDAKRLAQSGALVRQIVTAGICHLEADMVAAHLADWELNDLEFLFIENVGNLVCPSGYDLGEAVRVVLMSVTEGEDKPLKYPPLFNSADVAVITKSDLAEIVEFDRSTAYASIQAVRPGMPIIETSAKKGHGMTEWITYLKEQRQQMRNM
jgi:hydrogenase nickel incorporation protein HypB